MCMIKRKILILLQRCYKKFFIIIIHKKTKLYGICCPFAISKKASLSEIRLNFLLVKRHQVILASWRSKFAVWTARRVVRNNRKLGNCEIEWDFWCSLKCILTRWKSVSLLSIIFNNACVNVPGQTFLSTLIRVRWYIVDCTLLCNVRRPICCNRATRPSADQKCWHIPPSQKEVKPLIREVVLCSNEDLSPFFRKVDKAIQWIKQFVSLIFNLWVGIYPVYSAIPF